MPLGLISGQRRQAAGRYSVPPPARAGATFAPVRGQGALGFEPVKGGIKRAFAGCKGPVAAVDFNGTGEVPDEHDDWLEHRPPSAFIDSLAEVDQEQGNVVWHLTTLARLTERRSTGEWDASWGNVVIGSPEGGLIVGGPEAGAEMKSHYLIEHLRRSRIPEIDQPFVEEQDRLYAAVAGWPVINVNARGWYGYWRSAHGESGHRVPDEAKAKAKFLGSTWESSIELERLLIAPYVAQAVERRFTIEPEPTSIDGVTRTVLVPREERIWQSVLAPIYLQLFEALRRITEGEPGAATCRECKRPFLVLDARRRFFCNERERFRYAKRQQRRRLTAQEPETDSVLELLDHQIDEEERAERAVKADLASPDPWLPEKLAKTLRRRKRYR